MAALPRLTSFALVVSLIIMTFLHLCIAGDYVYTDCIRTNMRAQNRMHASDTILVALDIDCNAAMIE
jgi:hypothetical protein